MGEALRRGATLRTALRFGLVEAAPRPAISGEWWPVWWALGEFGWLDDALLDSLDRCQGPGTRVPSLRLVRRLYRIGWLVRDRPPGRPARPVRVTPQGLEVIGEIPAGAPAWTVSNSEVARRALAAALPVRGWAEVPSLCRSAAEAAASWSRLVRDVDVRAAVQEWRNAGWLTDGAPVPGRWLLTSLGRRAARSIAHATGTASPRRPRQQDEEHDRLLTNTVRRLLAVRPGLVGVVRIARRCPVAGLGGPGWIVPDAAVGFRCEDGDRVLVIEAERHGRYDGLVRHIRQLRQLAEFCPAETMQVAVVCSRRTPGRLAALSDALAEPGIPYRFQAMVTTPVLLPRQLLDWGIDGDAVPIPPPW
ncbi:hypothetical protein [Crossiella sp. CA198]|uniref:hypothetical protein n=1 Tax=Crossiella sp. CA198 TaxID=3455607 RepID=UPI003F8D6364